MNRTVRKFDSSIEVCPGIHSFFVRMRGDSMIEAGINDNDLLQVKSCIQPDEGDIVLIMVDNELIIRRYFLDNSRIVLMAENVNFPSMILDEYDQFEICGVITS